MEYTNYIVILYTLYKCLTYTIPEALYAIADAPARVVINYRDVALGDAEEVHSTLIVLRQRP